MLLRIPGIHEGMVILWIQTLENDSLKIRNRELFFPRTGTRPVFSINVSKTTCYTLLDTFRISIKSLLTKPACIIHVPGTALEIVTSRTTKETGYIGQGIIVNILILDGLQREFTSHESLIFLLSSQYINQSWFSLCNTNSYYLIPPSLWSC